jgi:hypothetical protein
MSKSLLCPHCGNPIAADVPSYLESYKTEILRLTAALKPFAQCATELDGLPDSTLLSVSLIDRKLAVRHFRAAAAASVEQKSNT